MGGASHRSAFDRGRQDGLEGIDAANPFEQGSPDHRNYVLGRSFGERDAAERRDFRAARPEASAPDHDETD